MYPDGFQGPSSWASRLGKKRTVDLLKPCLSAFWTFLTLQGDIPFLGNLIQREILYRFASRDLKESGLRAIANAGAIRVHRTAKAIAWLRG